MKKNADQYLLQDGTYADPADCKAGKDGVMRAKSGLAVALRDDGEPMTLSSVTEANEAAAKASADPGGLRNIEPAQADNAEVDTARATRGGDAGAKPSGKPE